MLQKIWQIPSSPTESPTERMILHNNNNKLTNCFYEITDWCFQEYFGGIRRRDTIRYVYKNEDK